MSSTNTLPLSSQIKRNSKLKPQSQQQSRPTFQATLGTSKFLDPISSHLDAIKTVRFLVILIIQILLLVALSNVQAATASISSDQQRTTTAPLSTATKQNVTTTATTTGEPPMPADTFDVSRETIINYHREISPHHFVTNSSEVNGTSASASIGLARDVAELQNGLVAVSSPAPTTTILTTNAMSPLEPIATLDVTQTSASTPTARALEDTATLPRDDEVSVAQRRRPAEPVQMNTIVVTNSEPEMSNRSIDSMTNWNRGDAKQHATQRFQMVAMAGRAHKFRCNSTSECENGALCHNGICFCLPGFTGDQCSINVDECRQFRGDNNEPPCLNGGACVDEVNAFRCQCAPGFQGERCQEVVDMCADAPCQNGAQCINHYTSYSCSCAPGWTGAQCQIDVDECAPPSPCQNNGTCRDLVNGFQCTCALGWTGDRCQVNVDDCAPDAQRCSPNTTLACIDLVNDYQCQCAPGFAGKNCQLNIDECLGMPCANGGQCIDLINGFKCLCPLGWTGDQCQLDVNECEAPEPVCKNGGACENLEASFRCHCRDGWTGPTCSDIGDYCKAKRPCGKHGTCKSIVQMARDNLTVPGQFKCDCQSGWLGSQCELRRDCNNECNLDHGHCVANTTTCACQPMEANGQRRFGCEFLASCSQLGAAVPLCLNGGSCRDLANQSGYECECAPNFTGPICQHSPDEFRLDLLLIVAIGGACCLLLGCAIVALLMFRRVRKARATRGTYSPSTQEKFESNSAVGGDLLKPPAPERLI